MNTQMKYSVFYSWQSDLPKETNQSGIRQCLRQSANELEIENSEIHIELDEATRNTPGSPNIPMTIFNKIENSDIFICDITTINENWSGRKVANPNVLIELGNAISSLGWDRIILLYNLKYGNFPDDVPFDIDRQRITTFKINYKNDKTGKGELSKVLKGAIKMIIEKQPLKPYQTKKETIEEKKRRLDVENLKWIFESIHIPTFDSFLYEFPDKIIHDIFYYELSFDSIFESSSFHIYDKKTFELIKEFKELWAKSLSFYERYFSNSGTKVYLFTSVTTSGERIKGADKDYQILFKIGLELKKSFAVLICHIRENYLEINVKETSQTAFVNFNRSSVEYSNSVSDE